MEVFCLHFKNWELLGVKKNTKFSEKAVLKEYLWSSLQDFILWRGGQKGQVPKLAQIEQLQKLVSDISSTS